MIAIPCGHPRYPGVVHVLAVDRLTLRQEEDCVYSKQCIGVIVRQFSWGHLEPNSIRKFVNVAHAYCQVPSQATTWSKSHRMTFSEGRPEGTG